MMIGSHLLFHLTRGWAICQELSGTDGAVLCQGTHQPSPTCLFNPESATPALHDILVRAKVPPQSSRGRRQAVLDFKKCDQTHYCSVCAHSANSYKHTCNSTGESFPITSSLSCLTPWVVYSISCDKGSGQCAQVKGPQYIGCTERPFKK